MRLHLFHRWGPWSWRTGESSGMAYKYRECRACPKWQVSLR